MLEWIIALTDSVKGPFHFNVRGVLNHFIPILILMKHLNSIKE